MYQLQDADYRTVGFGTREQIFDLVRHHIGDGRYRIVGPKAQVYCIRMRGVVYPDPARVDAEAHGNPKISTLQYMG